MSKGIKMRKKRTVYQDTIARRQAGATRLPGVIVEGVTYDTVSSAATAYGVTDVAIHHWINGQISESTGIFYPPFDNCQPVFANNKHKKAWRERIATNIDTHRAPPGYPPAVVIDGFIYPSTEVAAEEYGVSVDTIRNWCRQDTVANCWYESNKVYAKLVA